MHHFSSSKMHRAIAFAVVASILVGSAGWADLQPWSLALVGARVYSDPDGPAIDDAAVVIEKGAITAVGPRSTVDVPAGTTSIDCKGLTITAGFYNSHVHFTDAKRWNEVAAAPS